MIDVKVTWRDVFASLFVLIGFAFAFSVVAGWGWPLMNGARAGIVALGVSGVLACSASGWANEGAVAFKRPLVVVGSVLGVALFAIGIVGLLVGTMPALELMMATFVALWLITLVDRLVAPAPSRRSTAA